MARDCLSESLAAMGRKGKQREGLEEGQKKYDKGSKKTSGHATTSGQDYEVALLCLVFLRALRLATDFLLLSNDAFSGKFDDVVLFYKLEGDLAYKAIMVQAKHRETPAEKRLTASNPFKLRGYLDSFINIRNGWEKPVEVDGRKIEVTEVSLVLYTNTGCTFDAIAREVTAESDVKHLSGFIGAGGRLLRIPASQAVNLRQTPATSDFFRCVTLCVEQLRDNEVDQYLEQELTKVLALTSHEVAKSLKKQLSEGVKGWWEQRGESSCLTAESSEWKDVLQKQVARLNTYDTQLNLSFTQEALAAIRSVFVHKQSWITVADEYQAKATRVRLLQALANSCLVLEAGTLTTRILDGSWEEVAALWGTTVCPTLVADLSASSPEELSDLRERLQKEFGSHYGRRLGVIAQKKPPEGPWSVHEVEATWSALHQVTRDELLAVKVNLQGHVIPLHDVLGDGDVSSVMSDKVICTLCDPGAGVTQLGVAVHSSSLENYIPQCLQRTAPGKINYDELPDTLIFSYAHKRKFKVLNLSDLKSTNRIAGTTLVEGVNNESKIRKECCRLSVRGVREDVGLERNVTEFVPFTWLCKNSVVIVEGVAGVGKSTFVTMMCSKIKEQLRKSWVLRFDLAKNTAFLKGRDFSDTSNITTFLLHCLPREQQQGLQRYILEHSLYVTGNVFLFLDAFDEISPDYTDQCCHLIKGIASKVRFLQMIVTTRSITCKQVEDALETKAFSIPLFSEEEQVLFLESYSKSKLVNVDKSKISSLIEAAGPVLEVPLLCRMAAEVLLYSGDQDLLKYKHPWTKVLLYKSFVEQTIINRPVEKLELEEAPLVESLTRSHSKEHLRNLQALAVRKLMPEDQLSNCDLSTDFPDEKLGLVVSDGESVDFQHRTFAEYFLGSWLAQNWEKCDQQRLRDLLFQEVFVVATLSWSMIEKCELHKAVARGDEVENQLYLGTTDTRGLSALHVAAMTQGSQHVVEDLLESLGEDHGKQDKILGATPARYAEMCRNWEFLEALIGKGKALEGLTFLEDQHAAGEVLIEAVEQDLTGLFQFILGEHTEVVENRFQGRNTLLHEAAANNSIKILNFLINQGYNVNVVNHSGDTPLHASAALGHVEATKLLLQNGADPNQRGVYGVTPLTPAACRGNVEVVKLLLENGADIHNKDEFGHTVIRAVARVGNVEVVRLLLDKGADINTKDKDGVTTIMVAAFEGNVEVVKLLIDKGADINTQDKYGNTAIMAPSLGGNVEVVKLLINKGADIHTQDENGDTAITLAACVGNLKMMKLLIDKGADIHAGDKKGVTAIMAAARRGDVEVVKLLLAKGADINTQDKDGVTAIMAAAREGNLEIVKLLLEKGADIHSQNKNGETAITLAARGGYDVVVKVLQDISRNCQR